MRGVSCLGQGLDIPLLARLPFLSDFETKNCHIVVRCRSGMFPYLPYQCIARGAFLASELLPDREGRFAPVESLLHVPRRGRPEG